MLTPLHRAQIFERANQALRDSIIEDLRRQGWSREDAVQAVDDRMTRKLLKEEANNRQA